MSQRNILRAPGIKKGETITADFLNKISKVVNDNTVAISSPKQGGATDESTGLTDLNFTEVSRTETTVEITDSNGDTHDIDQIDQVVLTNASGDTLTLNFTN